MVLMNLFAGKEWRQRKQTCGHSWGRREWDEWRKQHRRVKLQLVRHCCITQGAQPGGLLRTQRIGLGRGGRLKRDSQFSQSVQSLSRVRFCNPMNRRTPGLPVYHQLLESPQTHVHRVGDAVQPSHPRSSPSPPAPTPSQHQGIFPMSQLFA